MESTRTGGPGRQWSYNPQSVEDEPILSRKLSHHDEYFAEDVDDTETTLTIVLMRLLEDLPEKEREALRQVVINGLSLREASEILKCSHQSAKNRSVRGAAMLKQRLKESVWFADMLGGSVPADEMPTQPLATTERVSGVLSELAKRKAA
jgi:hypothetical protein